MHGFSNLKIKRVGETVRYAVDLVLTSLGVVLKALWRFGDLSTQLSQMAEYHLDS